MPSRLEVEVGASYLTPPNEVKAAVRRALANSPLVLPDPPPLVVVQGFGASAMDYVAKFWVADYATDNQAKDQVRTSIWYEFRRANIEIPWPIQIEYSRDEQPVRTQTHIDVAAAQLARLDLFSTLPAEARRELVASSSDQLFAGGEPIVRQGDHGHSMFVVLQGTVAVVLEPSGQQVATLGEGAFFGEMSMLTGEPRTATVRAIGDVRVLEVGAEDMRRVAQATPGLMEHISQLLPARRVGLAAAEATAAALIAGQTHERQSLLARIQAYWGI